jgi:hypothetical protein
MKHFYVTWLCYWAQTGESGREWIVMETVVLLVVGSSDRMLYRVTGSENVVIGCALRVETAVTADRRIIRKNGG